MEMNDALEFRPGNLLRSLLRRWPLIALCGVLGAATGLGLSSLRPAIYAAETTIGVSISYALTEPLDLVVEDRVYDRVAGLIQSDQTMERVWHRIPESDVAAREWRTLEDLRAVMRLDRRLSEWGMVVLSEDPQFAAQVSMIWSEESLKVLRDALDHAWQLAQLVNQAAGAEFEAAEEISVDWYNRRIWECQIVPFEIEPELLEGPIRTELNQSRGLFPSLVIELLREAVPPDAPIIWGRGTLILGGCLIGIMAGLIGLAVISQSNDTMHGD